MIGSGKYSSYMVNKSILQDHVMDKGRIGKSEA